MNTIALIEALFFLQTRTVANHLRVRLKRLRQPKYMVSGIMGLGYFYLIWGRHLISIGGATRAMPPFSPEIRISVLNIATVVVATLAACSWIFTSGRAALAFTETELAFLLPAPMSRRLLLRYKMIKSTLMTLFSAVICSLITGRFVRDGHAVFHIVGWWLALVVMNFHGMAASFTVQRLTDRGLASWKRRCLAVVVLVLVAGIVMWWLYSVPSPPLKQLQSEVGKSGPAISGGWKAMVPIADWFNDAVSDGPAYWILLPARIAVMPWFATTWLEFGRSTLVALGLIAALGWWVESSDIAFEEASLNFALKQAGMVARVRAGKGLRSVKRKSVKPLWELKPTGHPVVAFLWKNLIKSGFTRRSTLTRGIVVALIVVARFGLPEETYVMICFPSMVVGLVLILAGGAICGRTLIDELDMMDVLKLYPLRGWQIVAGQLSGGIAVVTSYVWAALVVAIVFVPQDPNFSEIRSMQPVAVSVALAVMGPPLAFLMALIPAAAAIYFPAWVRAPKNAQAGFEVTGQRLLMVCGVLLTVVFALVPAAAVGGAIAGIGTHFGFPALSILAGGILASTLLAVEAAVGAWFLGQLFERYDSSSE